MKLKLINNQQIFNNNTKTKTSKNYISSVNVNKYQYDRKYKFIYLTSQIFENNL